MSDVNGALSGVLYLVIIIAVPMLLRVFDSYVDVKKKEMKDSSKSKYFEETKEKAVEIIQDTVDCITQTYVEELKKQGKFDQTKQKEAFNAVLEKVKVLMGEEARETLKVVYTDLDEWIGVQIESYIHSTKVEAIEE